MECEFCQKIFSTKGTLKTHQKTAKYCIKLQEKKGNNIEKFFCQYCNKELSQRQVIFHEQKCEKFILIEKAISFQFIELHIFFKCRCSKYLGKSQEPSLWVFE
jgi:hypothetical protein